MAKRVGDEFDGVITGVARYGFFVRLDRMGVEGMVRMSTIDDDYYALEEKQYRIVGKRTGRIFRLGDHIRVGVLKVDKLAAEMDLYIVDPPAKRSKKAPTEKASTKRTSTKKKASTKKTAATKKKVSTRKLCTSSDSISPDGLKALIRSAKFFNCRTFPGQSYRTNISSAESARSSPD